jgi:hypothetical protein
MDVSRDFMAWDNTEQVTLEITRRLPGQAVDQTRPAPASDLVALPVAKRRMLNSREKAASLGAYTAGQLKWIVPRAVLGDVRPKEGDVIVDADGERWTVLSFDLGKWRQTWQMVCINLAIAHDLRDVCDVQRAVVTYDASGAAHKEWSALHAGLSCRVQPDQQELREERGVRGDVIRYRVYVDRELYVRVTEDRIAWNGRYLDIREYQNAQRIDELPVLVAEGKP